MRFLSLLFLLLFSYQLMGSDTTRHRDDTPRPKIGVVLSGGGAKGFAHIGFLKVLKEAGIKPDYITGVSMGAVVGGLSAIGYTPEQLEEISISTNWDDVISNKIPLNQVAIEEKDYYGRYITEFGIEEKRITLPNAVVEGQQLHLMLSRLTSPVHGLNDFSKFPTPFACVATNITNGEPITLNNGNLAKAMRASMAIPSIFSPIEIDGKLLVDGGLVHNLPVKEAIDMGADIIIASYTGARFKSKEELNGVQDILKQSAFVTSILDSREEMTKADYLVKPISEKFQAADFNKADSIIKMGYESTKYMLPQLKKLADSLYSSSFEAVNVDTTDVKLPSEIKIDSIAIRGNKAISDELILGKLGIEPNDPYSIELLEKRINVAYGTQYFKRISYNLEFSSDSTSVLILDIEEVPKASVKTALHYDNETGIGLTLNLTTRNAIFEGSRTIFEVDIADNPRVDLNYFKYLGQNQNIAYTIGGKFSNQKDISSFGAKSGVLYNASFTEVSSGIMSTSSPNISIGGRMLLNLSRLKPTFNRDSLVNIYSDRSLAAEGFFLVNSMDRVFFPTKGVKADIRYRYNLSSDLNAGISSNLFLLEDAFTENFSLNNYHTLEFNIEKRFKLHPHFSTYLGVAGAIHTTDTVVASDRYFIGGFTPILSNSISFWGADVYEFAATNFSMVKAGVQYQPFNKFYVELQANYIHPNEPFHRVLKSVEEQPLLSQRKTFEDALGAGIRLSYMSPIGPVSCGVYQNSNNPTIGTYISVGFKY
ncbi:MAG: patatin-like phospholipase family protein [Salibacter sp.]|uniref:patatin-like phospholipase family protein n=1 Tax=Salibacter sp. TaxID=2010995 RepID=UPI00286FCC34|nr:patatin-like phospholipase family protein [Salibacter sp.]MDR9397616.1 patatin-like phospholipase family protein [Salibacter sp.]